MAATYGFRAYVVEVYPNSFKGKEPLRAHADSRVSRRIARLLETAHSLSTQEYQPRPSPPGEPNKLTATLTVGDPAVLRADFLHVLVEAGVVGQHSKATKVGADPQDLSDRSAEAGHTFAFFFSRREGDTKFIVIAETINGRDPMRRLISLLQKIDIDRRNRRLADDREARRRARAAGLPAPAHPERVRLAFDWHQASDSDYLLSILGSAKSISAVFKGHKPSSRGGAEVIDRTLTISLRDGDESKVGSAVARVWERRQRSGQRTANADGVSELADVLEQQNLIYEGEAEHYDDAALRVVAENGARTTIAIDTLRDVFTYPVHDGPPAPTYFYSKVSDRLQIIAREAGIRVNSIDAAEVVEWLGD